MSLCTRGHRIVFLPSLSHADSEAPKTKTAPMDRNIRPNGTGKTKTGKPIIHSAIPAVKRIGFGIRLMVQHNRMFLLSNALESSWFDNGIPLDGAIQ
jgi:hypothetical protein